MKTWMKITSRNELVETKHLTMSTGSRGISNKSIIESTITLAVYSIDKPETGLRQAIVNNRTTSQIHPI